MKFYLWRALGSYPRYVISGTKPEFACVPELSDTAPVNEETPVAALAMSEWHVQCEADTFAEAKAKLKFDLTPGQRDSVAALNVARNALAKAARS
jgi:hypothetical protein